MPFVHRNGSETIIEEMSAPAAPSIDKARPSLMCGAKRLRKALLIDDVAFFPNVSRSCAYASPRLSARGFATKR
jgi:hypothetical protein